MSVEEVWNGTHQHANTSYFKNIELDRGGREDLKNLGIIQFV